MKPRSYPPMNLAGNRKRGARFGFPDMNPATLLFLTQELRRARKSHPDNNRTLDLISHYLDRTRRELAEYAAGRSNAITVQMTALQIAVMAIRLSEEGIAGHPYKGNAPTLPGPLGEHMQKVMEESNKLGQNDPGFQDLKTNASAMEALTAKVTRK